MLEATIDKTSNLIQISYQGRVDAQESKESVGKIRALLTELKPGFRMLTDLRALDSMDLGCMPYIEEVMDLCDDLGIKAVVRVIPDPHKDIGLNIMSLFHYGRRVQIITCKTIEEAKAALATSVQ